MQQLPKSKISNLVQSSASLTSLPTEHLTANSESRAPESFKQTNESCADNKDTETKVEAKAPKLFDHIPTQRPHTPLLDKIDSPKDLKNYTQAQLLTLADELRAFVLYSAGLSGGHFGANLGVIELTVALHYLLDTPNDKLVWDVGHQAYAHKVLTGRRERLATIRAKDGLTAFPERAESIYDTFGVGHSSTAVSAGLGMSLALRHLGSKATVACVVGDGAMTGGMTFEAMNDAVQQNADLLVILNDNDMSISCSIGGFSRHLAMLWESGYQVDITASGKPKLVHRPEIPLSERRTRHSAERDIPQVADNLFKAIGFTYFGPFDGHDLPELLRVIERAKQVRGPVLVHIYTTKGKGFSPAEQDPVGYHAIAKLPKADSVKSQAEEKATASNDAEEKKKFSAVFGEFICDKASEDANLIAITPAMESGSGMSEFAQHYPEQFFDVAIAEQHAVTLAGGMATQGVKPIVAIYSTFLQRGYDQFIHDVALQNLNVMFAIDRAGLVGEDGATHAGVFDLAYLRCVPNVIIATPKDENECYQLLNTCYDYHGVSAVRYPRGVGTGAKIQKPAQVWPVGQALLEATYENGVIDCRVNDNNSMQTADKSAAVETKVALLAFGPIITAAHTAARMLIENSAFDKYSVSAISVVNMRWVKPLDSAIIDGLIEQGYTHMVTLEEHAVNGGAGSAVNEYILNHSLTYKSIDDSKTTKPVVKNIGIPDKFIAHGCHEEQLADCRLDAYGIVNQITSFL